MWGVFCALDYCGWLGDSFLQRCSEVCCIMCLMKGRPTAERCAKKIRKEIKEIEGKFKKEIRRMKSRRTYEQFQKTLQKWGDIPSLSAILPRCFFTSLDPKDLLISNSIQVRGTLDGGWGLRLGARILLNALFYVQTAHWALCLFVACSLLFELYYYMINDIWTYDMMSTLTHIGCCRSIKWDSWSRYFQMLYLRRHIPDVESEAVQLRSITESSWKRYHPLIFDSIRDAHSQWRIPVIQCQIIWDLSLRGSLQIAA